VHGKSTEHTAMAAETIARNANTDREQALVRSAARNMVLSARQVRRHLRRLRLKKSF
jgi:hypothetical protein